MGWLEGLLEGFALGMRIGLELGKRLGLKLGTWVGFLFPTGLELGRGVRVRRVIGRLVGARVGEQSVISIIFFIFFLSLQAVIIAWCSSRVGRLLRAAAPRRSLKCCWPRIRGSALSPEDGGPISHAAVAVAVAAPALDPTAVSAKYK